MAKKNIIIKMCNKNKIFIKMHNLFEQKTLYRNSKFQCVIPSMIMKTSKKQHLLTYSNLNCEERTFQLYIEFKVFNPFMKKKCFAQRRKKSLLI